MALRFAMLKLKRRVDGVMAGLLLSYLFWGSFLLLRCGDVESNPGPPAPPAPPAPAPSGPNSSQPRDNVRQTRQASAGMGSSRASRASLDRFNYQGGASNQPATDPSLSDIMDKLHSMDTRSAAMDSKFDTKFEEVKQEFNALREDNVSLREELRGLREEVSGLRQQNQDLQRKNDHLAEKLDYLDRKVDDLEGRSKRNNLVFYGVARRENETNSDCEDILKDLFMDKLELARDVEMDRVHRVSSRPDSPIVARCVFYKQKVDILKAKTKLKGTNIFVGEDFSTKVRDQRKRLTPHLKRARGDGKRATIVYNHILIDGKRFTVDSADRLIESI
jgi:polyhydroxyalkanoate synthesis regulator phasin